MGFLSPKTPKPPKPIFAPPAARPPSPVQRPQSATAASADSKVGRPGGSLLANSMTRAGDGERRRRTLLGA